MGLSVIYKVPVPSILQKARFYFIGDSKNLRHLAYSKNYNMSHKLKT